ncbi:MAG: hypothetical protein SGJ21_17070 [Alphaproteobacteria bacterium]|nr:hypothetical protein [Alphaproteobacteria bacterium]
MEVAGLRNLGEELLVEDPEIARRLLWAGFSGALLTMLFTIYAGPHSAATLEARVEAAAGAALAAGGFSWASAQAHGQKIILRGRAPSEAAQAEASRAALKSLGPGGPIAGGVTKVMSGVEGR